MNVLRDASRIPLIPGIVLILSGLLLVSPAWAQRAPAPSGDREGGWWPAEPDRRPPVVVDERRGRGDVEGRGGQRRGDRGRRGQRRDDRERADRDDRWERDDQDDRWEREERDAERRPRRAPQRAPQAKRRSSRGGGPPFCHNGSGHPVHGMAWCREKGFASDRYERRRRYERDGRYDRRRFRERRRPRFRRLPGLEGLPLGSLERRSGEPSRLTGTALARVLGSRLYRRLGRVARRRGMRRPVEGRLLRSGDERRTLQLRAGGQPLAELIDRDDDGRVDRALVTVGWR